ncbi:MAG TPA: substrate-binding domain-containing protein, partial [Chitinophagaceae bacterium]|nr:substrate-binding domain-containing protein [Chitinophagaceae bacterium]
EHLQHFEPFTRKNIPLVFFDRVAALGACTQVLIDNRKAGYEATRHLIEQGCRNLLHITATSKRNVYADRLEGFRQALEEAGLPFQPDQVLVTSLGAGAGAEAAAAILRLPERPDGIFVANDNCAAACLMALKKAGLRIPEDIAIAGFNNDPVCTVVEPNLTTIHYPGQEMGEAAARHLVNHLDGASGPARTETILLRSELIVRASSLRVG